MRKDTLGRHFKAKHALHTVIDFNIANYVVGTPSLSNLNPRKKPCLICGKGITPKNKAKHMRNQHGLGEKRSYDLSVQKIIIMNHENPDPTKMY
jgi:hypothetical protein